MKQVFGTFLCFWALILAHAQPIEVPEQLYFAGMTLHLTQGLRSELQKQVLEITKNKTYFQAKVSRADAHFPTIEKAFTEEDIPLDFKFLVIQESSIQADAVSGSNAVGYWQFKRESGEEVGLIINSEVDERKHLLESSRGAARYLKKNYLMLTNWIYALIAYNTGLGGVKAYVDNKYVGANEMYLDKDLHWYAIKFLAFKLAYEDKVGYNKAPDITLLAYSKNTSGKTLQDLAAEIGVSEEKLKEYNKWLLTRRIPDNKSYTVMVPVTYLERDQMATKLGIDLQAVVQKNPEVLEPTTTLKPELQQLQPTGVPLLVTANNLNAIYARKGDNVASLAFQGTISIEKFLRYNDMQKFEEVQPGKLYYLESKNNKGITLYHTAVGGETMWDIAQKYGIKLKQLLRKNRMEESDALQTGRLIYLKYKRPDDEPIVIAETPKKTPETTVVSPPVVPTPVMQVTKEQGVNMRTQDTVAKATPTQVPDNKVVAVAKTDSVVAAPSQVARQRIPSLRFGVPDSGLGYHIVVMQQTLFAISRHYGVKMDTIRAWNNLGQEGVKYDQLLIVRNDRETINNGYDLYVVKASQDINSIAAEIGVSVENLLLWNRKKGTAVLAGELLKVKKRTSK